MAGQPKRFKRDFDFNSAPVNKRGQFNYEAENDNDTVGKAFVAKTKAQEELAVLIKSNDVSFGIGPAGTGKTHVAVALAAEALKRGEVKKIIISRPVKEAGESLGFQKGTMQEKMDPYMKPIYDILDAIYGDGKYQDMIERGTIEIVPLAFMRGRTLKNAFIILDEAQNTTLEPVNQMEMALTRMGEGSKMVITGDHTQIDHIDKKNSGLLWAIETFQNIEGIGMKEFTSKDVMRSPIVEKIVNAIEKRKALENGGETSLPKVNTSVKPAGFDKK